MATKTKSKSTQPPAASHGLISAGDRLAMLIEWIDRSEKLWFVNQFTLTEAAKESPVPLMPGELSELAKEHARFWTKLKLRKEFAKPELDQAGWDHVYLILDRVLPILNEEDSTLNVCLALLISRGAPLNRSLLNNCSRFHRLTNRRFKIR